MGPFELMRPRRRRHRLRRVPQLLRAGLRRAALAPLSDPGARWSPRGCTGARRGRGYYDYSGEGPHRPADPEPPEAQGPGDDGALVAISGEGTLAAQLREAAQAAGYEVRTPQTLLGELPALIVECDLGWDFGAHPASRASAASAAGATGQARGVAARSAAGHPGRPELGPARVVLCAGGPLAALDNSGTAAASMCSRRSGRRVSWS